MSKLIIIIFLLHLLLSPHNHHLSLAAANSPTGSNAPAADFIRAECRATRYPALCIQCLSNYSTTIQLSLAQAALSVSLARAQAVASFVARLARMKGMRPTETAAVRDCTENMGVTLGRSMKELDSMGRVAGQDFDWHVSNLQTWVSAALTNENTSLDGFAGAGLDGKVKVAVTRRVLGCAQVTSNALALVNRFAARHKAGDLLDSIGT